MLRYRVANTHTFVHQLSGFYSIIIKVAKIKLQNNNKCSRSKSMANNMAGRTRSLSTEKLITYIWTIP